MTYTPTTIFGGRLVGKLAPWLTHDLARYADAVGVMFDPVLELAEEEGTDGEPGFVPSWGKLLNPELCPAKFLPYLGQFVGATIPVGASDAEARALVKAESGLERGTRASIESAIERNLAPGAAYQIIERRNPANEEKAYQFLVVIQGSKLNQSWFVTKDDWTEQTGKWESPATDTTDLEVAVNAVKPAGLIWHLLLTEELPWLLATGSWESQMSTWALA